MGPRKKPKPNPKAEPNAQSTTKAQENGNKTVTLTANTPEEPESSKSSPDVESVKNYEASTPHSTTSWYGGTWPRGHKATPVTHVVKETISAAGGIVSDVMAAPRSHTPPLPTTPLRSSSAYLSRNMGSSSRSVPLAATTTKLNITSSPTNPANGSATDRSKPKTGVTTQDQRTQTRAYGLSTAEKTEELPAQNSSSDCAQQESDVQNKPSDDTKPHGESASWLGWFLRTEQVKGPSTENVVTTPASEATDKAAKNRPKSTLSEIPHGAPQSSVQRRNSEPNRSSPTAQLDEQGRSWLGLWGYSSTQTAQTKSASATISATNSPEDLGNIKPSEVQANKFNAESISQLRPPPLPAEVTKSYGWSFWSKDDSKDNESGRPRSGSTVGKLALADSPSQSKPENAIIDETRGVPSKVGKRQKPQSLELTDDRKLLGPKDNPNNKYTKTDAVLSSPKTKPTADVDAKTKPKKEPKNLLLPAFKRTFGIVGRPSLIQQISRLLSLSSIQEPKHVDLVPNPPQIKRALAIGVHGYFPTPLIRSVLGQPTGTSIRFANSAASAIQRWTQDQGYSCEIEKVALEGEGKIAERIDLLWKLMLNWIEKMRKADFIMISCHSQGVPVTMSLVAKLIAFGCVNSAKIGICAMAGVNLGPFADYKSRWISGSAGELFDFAQPDSQVSKDYEASLDVALRFGVKIVYIGSIDDQLVSLESSTFGTINHPHIYRAVFVDGRVHAPDFLTHLVGFCLKLRNLGISDHGLIRELSSPLAGSLYGGEGHSRIYDDESVYYLAVEHALKTTSLGSIGLQMQRDSLTTGTQNPYILPFAMRGLLEEEYVRTELYGETTELIRQFDDWKPSSKVLKDVKFRLEGVRSKL